MITLDRPSRRSLRDQLFEQLRSAILDGRLSEGMRLPSTRALASELGISRFTVEDAFERLVAEGYAVGRHGSGTYVTTAGVRPTELRPVDLANASAERQPAPQRAWSEWAQRTIAMGGIDMPRHRQPYDFRAGTPALELFPYTLWRQIAARVRRTCAPKALLYGPIAGTPELRAMIAAYLGRSRGIICHPHQVIITTGTQQGLDLLSRLLVDPGQPVAIEDPGYFFARRIFKASGARLQPVPVDDDGLQVEALKDLDPATRLIYTTPSHQYPTGGVLPLARRLRLLEWARNTNTLIVEDDYDGEFRYGRRPVEALASLDAASGGLSTVAYVGTFSKVLFPGLRLGYLVLPKDMVEATISAKGMTDLNTAVLDQLTLRVFMAEGHFERHLARMRRAYQSRQAAALGAVGQHLEGLARRVGSANAAGLHLMLEFQLSMTEDELRSRANEAGVNLEPSSNCYEVPPTKPTVLLGYASVPEETIWAGVAQLASALRESLAA